MRAARLCWVGFFFLAAVLAAPTAHAGIIAAVNEPVPNGTSCPTQTDIALIDPATGAKDRTSARGQHAGRRASSEHHA